MPDHFHDRREAGRRLAELLGTLHLAAPVVLALPRGGVPVAFEIARALAAPLDLLLVRKIGAPANEEFGIGAVVDGTPPIAVLDDELVRLVGASPAYVEAQTRRQVAEMARRRTAYLAGRSPVPLEGRTAIVVDDGIATGGTARAALRGLAERRPARRVLAVPVAPPDTVAALQREGHEVVCLLTPEPFGSVGEYYDNFGQTDDAEVTALLEESRRG